MDGQDSKTTMLLGLSALIDILSKAVDGFELHPLDDASTLPPLTNSKVEDGFPSACALAFRYMNVRDKRNRVAKQPTVTSAPSPHRFDDEEDYKAPTAMWGVIKVRGKTNVKEACKALAWHMSGLGLQIWWKDHQSAESSAQVLLMCVPPQLKRGGGREQDTLASSRN
jgi:hypothetical protein